MRRLEVTPPSLAILTPRKTQVTHSYRRGGRADYAKGSSKQITSGQDIQAPGAPAAVVVGACLTTGANSRFSCRSIQSLECSLLEKHLGESFPAAQLQAVNQDTTNKAIIINGRKCLRYL